MGSILDVLNPVSAIADVGTGIANSVLGFQNLAYNKATQQKTWEREDTAVGRRVADLKAAGLSPTLAAGSAAQTSAPINVGIPSLPTDSHAKVAAVTDVIRQKQDIARSAASTALLAQQTNQTLADTLNKNAMREGIFADNARKGIEAETAGTTQNLAKTNLAERKRNIDIYSHTGSVSDYAPSPYSAMQGGADQFSQLMDRIRNALLGNGGAHAGAALDAYGKIK